MARKLRKSPPKSRRIDSSDGDEADAAYRAKAVATMKQKKLRKAQLRAEAKERMKTLTKGQQLAAFKGKSDPRNGRGPAKGSGGRPPDAWKKLMGRLVNRPSTIKALKKVLRDEKHGAWFGAFKFGAEQKYGKAKESMDVTGKLTLEDVLTRSREKE